MRKIIIFLILILFSVNIVNAFNVVVPYTASTNEINLSSDYNGEPNTIYYQFPPNVFQNVNYVDGMNFLCGKSDDAVGNYHINIYTYTTYQLITGTLVTGNLQLIDSANIDVSACLDYGYKIDFDFLNPIDVSYYYLSNNTIVIGIYSNVGTGNVITFGSPNALGYFTPQLSTPPYINNLFGNPVYFHDIENKQIKSISYNLYGQYKFPSTPQPPPEGNDEVIGNVPDIGNGTLPDFNAGGGFWTPDFNNSSIPCGTDGTICLHNETVITSGLNRDDSNICQGLTDMGYGNEGNCSIYDFFDFLYDVGWFLFGLSIWYMGYKFIYLGYIKR